jgi:hypothetical protein
MAKRTPESKSFVPMPELGTAPMELYQVVAARRLQWDTLLWQVPVLSLTGQAFLFTIALTSGNSRFARGASAVLALIAILLSMMLMTRHRQAEIADANWLRAWEEANWPSVKPVHGLPWVTRRATIAAGGPFSPLSRLPGYITWMAGFLIFAVVAVLIVFGVVLGRIS